MVCSPILDCPVQFRVAGVLDRDVIASWAKIEYTLVRHEAQRKYFDITVSCNDYLRHCWHSNDICSQATEHPAFCPCLVAAIHESDCAIQRGRLLTLGLRRKHRCLHADVWCYQGPYRFFSTNDGPVFAYQDHRHRKKPETAFQNHLHWAHAADGCLRAQQGWCAWLHQHTIFNSRCSLTSWRITRSPMECSGLKLPAALVTRSFQSILSSYR